MSEQKTWIEIVLMPIVVAVVGVLGTYFITKQQAANALLERHTELEKTQEIADADRQIKILEIFSEKITSESQEERVLALKLLTSLDGALAEKLAVAVSESADNNSVVKMTADNIVEKSRQSGNSFPVIMSTKDFNLAVKKAREIIEQNSLFMPEIYLAKNGYYALTLGGYLPAAEANRRVNYARESNISADAYVRTTMAWGEDLLAFEVAGNSSEE